MCTYSNRIKVCPYTGKQSTIVQGYLWLGYHKHVNRLCSIHIWEAIVITGYYAKPDCYTSSVSNAGWPEVLLIVNH